MTYQLSLTADRNQVPRGAQRQGWAVCSSRPAEEGKAGKGRIQRVQLCTGSKQQAEAREGLQLEAANCTVQLQYRTASDASLLAPHPTAGHGAAAADSPSAWCLPASGRLAATNPVVLPLAAAQLR